MGSVRIPSTHETIFTPAIQAQHLTHCSAQPDHRVYYNNRTFIHKIMTLKLPKPGLGATTASTSNTVVHHTRPKILYCHWSVIGLCQFHGRCHGDISDLRPHHGCWSSVDVEVGFHLAENDRSTLAAPLWCEDCPRPCVEIMTSYATVLIHTYTLKCVNSGCPSLPRLSRGLSKQYMKTFEDCCNIRPFTNRTPGCLAQSNIAQTGLTSCSTH